MLVGNGSEIQYHKGVKHLCENGISEIPNKYILPILERPISKNGECNEIQKNLKLPIIDFSEFNGPNHSQVIASLSHACEKYGFFQVVNHGIPKEVITNMIDVSTRFFELSYEERSKFMSSNMFAPVRYGTSFNQNKDKVFCWRDFLKLSCHPVSDVLPYWPSSPLDFRTMVGTYARETKYLFEMLMEAILAGLGMWGTTTISSSRKKTEEDACILQEFKDGSQLMVLNCYPTCPQPDLTLGMPPHSDYGFLTLLLQDHVAGLEIQCNDQWVTVDPIPNSFVVNVGDHLEIFSNGKYKSVLHRVLVNSSKPRISVASLHSLPFTSMVKPYSRLIDDQNPKLYMDTDFATFLQHVSSCEPKHKNFLASRKIHRDLDSL